MSDHTTRSNADVPTVLSLAALKKAKQEQDRQSAPVRVQVQVACQQPAGKIVQDRFTAELESLGCRVVGDDKPDWILSVIAFSAGNTVELSVVLRRLFRSTSPGTEVDRIDEDDTVHLRAGGWVYESLRFHGLFGVYTGELDPFIAKLVRDFPLHRTEQKAKRKIQSDQRRI